MIFFAKFDKLHCMDWALFSWWDQFKIQTVIYYIILKSQQDKVGQDQIQCVGTREGWKEIENFCLVMRVWVFPAFLILSWKLFHMDSKSFPSFLIFCLWTTGLPQEFFLCQENAATAYVSCFCSPQRQKWACLSPTKVWSLHVLLMFILYSNTHLAQCLI